MASEWQVLLFCLAVLSICMVLTTATLFFLIISFTRTLQRVEALIPQAEKLLHRSNQVACEIDALIDQTQQAAARFYGHLNSFARNTRTFFMERFGFHHGQKSKMHHRSHRMTES